MKLRYFPFRLVASVLSIHAFACTTAALEVGERICVEGFIVSGPLFDDSISCRYVPCISDPSIQCPTIDGFLLYRQDNSVG